MYPNLLHHVSRRNAYGAIASILVVSICSCQSLPHSGKTTTGSEPVRLPATTNNSAATPQRLATQSITSLATRPITAPVRPQVTTGSYASPLPHTVQPMAMASPVPNVPCPCCSPRGKFAFSDACGPAGYGEFGGDENGACESGACGNGSCGYCPYDEYICDGGDNFRNVKVRRDWKVFGLEQEDTIVHFDTVDGRTEHSASNKVCIYAPRFAAVRQVTGLESSEQADQLAGANKAIPPITGEELKIVSALNQPVQPVADLGVRGSQSFLERQPGLTAETTRHLAQAHLDLLPYENFDRIRRGVMENSEKLRLAQVAANAVVWTREQAVQVVLDKKLPLEAVRDTQLGETVMYDRQGKPRMRMMKIADKSEAQPGDIVSFTLRFDNVGDQKVGNVTIIDNLTTRLEYVEESQECSHQANFVTTLNDGETLTLKWEIADSLRVGEGGIIRFKCRVR